MECEVISYIFDNASATVLPAEMHQRVLRLVYVQESLPLIGVNHFTLHRHFAGLELDQVLALASARRAPKKRSHVCHFGI